MSEAIMTPSSREKIDLSDWTLDTLDKDGLRLTERLVLAAASEAIQIAATDYDAMAYFHSEKDDEEGRGGDGPIGDLLTIRIMIPLGQEFDGPTWDFSLSEVIDEFIAGRIHLCGKVGTDYEQSFQKLRTLLATQIAKIDAVLPACTTWPECIPPDKNEFEEIMK
jgi:hypothetical protein